MVDSAISPTHKVRSLIVNGVTGLNLVLGLAALIATIQGFPNVAAWFLLAAVVADAADGSLARHWKVSSEFGAQLDSLADMTSFIVASSVLAFYWFSPDLPLPWLAAASGVLVLAGAIRLARFNVVSLPVNGQFQGMPTTAVAALVSMTYLTYPQLNHKWGVALLIMLSLLMVSVFPYPKLCRVLRYPRWIFGVMAVGAVIDLSWTLWLSAVGYILAGPVSWLQLRLRGSEPAASCLQ